jgi:hypothetical protein
MYTRVVIIGVAAAVPVKTRQGFRAAWNQFFTINICVHGAYVFYLIKCAETISLKMAKYRLGLFLEANNTSTFLCSWLYDKLQLD